MKIVGIDVGGTFTDIVFTDTQTKAIHTHKVASTPDDSSQGVMQAINEICSNANIRPEEIAHVFHGTTVATNAVLQYRGAKSGMITTENYRDIIHIGRHQRPQHYSIVQEIPWQTRPLVQRRFRKTVRERLIPPTGEIKTPLDEEAVGQAARELNDAGVESIAVCFLFSYLNPIHEQRAKEIVSENCPGVFVTTSSEVSPQFREFERFTTAAMNAFIGPLVRKYVNNFEAKLRDAGISAKLHIMRSNGGVATAKTVSELPVYTLMSGLAAGVMGGVWVGSLAGCENVITFDVGGTSADIGVITGGALSEASARDTFVGGYPVMVPMLDLHTIGAGGGSIAHVDAGGGFKVGPQSAGAEPGPAAYGHGGTEATVTDANLVLGRLDKDNFLGGAMTLDVTAATAVVQNVAEKLGMPLIETAEGIITLLNSNMANAVRARTVQKGIDPRNYTLVASGGAGPLHGAEVARMLEISKVIVPPYPGINSAIGLLTTDLKYDVVQTAFLLSNDIDFQRLNAQFVEMAAQLHHQFEIDGVDSKDTRYHRYADVRYLGQGYELRISIPDGEINQENFSGSLDEFHQLHQNEYGHSFPEKPVEFVNVRLVGVGPIPKIDRPPVPADGQLEAAVSKIDSTAFRIGNQVQQFDTTFYRREALPLNKLLAGPAIILQTDSTTVVPPDSSFCADSVGTLTIHVGKSAG